MPSASEVPGARLQPATDVLRDVTEAIDRIRAARRRLFAAPATAQAVRQAAERAGLAGYLELTVTDAVPEGEVLVLAPQTLERIVQPFRYLPVAPPGWPM